MTTAGRAVIRALVASLLLALVFLGSAMPGTRQAEAAYPGVSGKILFTSDRTGYEDVWVMDGSGANPRNLSDSEDWDGYAIWSPLLPPLTKGDVDCDGDIGEGDGVKGLRSMATLAVTEDEPCPDIGAAMPSGEVWGDMDCDGDIDARDFLLHMRYIMAMPVGLPEGCAAIGE